MTSSPRRVGLSKRYLAGSVLLGALSIGAFVLQLRSARAQEAYAAVLNVSGRQRMLAKHIALVAQRMLGEENRESIYALRQDLLAAINQMEKAHLGLIHGDHGLGLPGLKSDVVRWMYFNAPMRVDFQVRSYLAEARDVAAQPKVAKGSFAVSNLVEASDKLIESLDAVVLQFQHETQEETDNLRTLQIIGLCALLIVLYLVAERTHAAESATRAKSEFLASLSHEIRTPMNAIVGMADLLAEKTSERERREYLDLMRTASGALLNLVDSTLDLSKIESGHLELDSVSFDLRELCELSVKLMKVRAEEKGIAVRFESGGDVPKRVMGDPKRLQQIVFNLLGNAVKFTDVGSVVLALSYVEEEARLAVRDTGPGIAKNKLQMIFEPFTQADSSVTRRHGGSGLGLTIAKKLVERMGGAISVESTLGKGSVFSVRVPLKAAPQNLNAKAGGGRVIARPLQILVVDDSQENCLLLERYLKGHSVVVAHNGKLALDRLVGSRFDVVLMDMQMPVMDGYSAARRIREWEARDGRIRVPIIALTAHAMSEDRAKSLDAGCTAYLAKPIRKEALIEAVAEAAGA